ncbi:monofunctional biosynthetic peptidoglycan transglycosylase [Flavisolibacter nicotianae]|uniref:monofunctional biosynthetic peptidoglycan transglycosylase n=1 Tax=Flavisolibacter nicotianae TaxID=2364882 RepID=UPI000EB252D7|nr:monofunctional biosynthetic peptidoglycan transglycosylase [Flavisolibacter nicotianae]
MKAKKKGSRGGLWSRIKRILLLLFVLHLLYIVALKWINPPLTLTQVGSMISGDGLKRDYVGAGDISPNLKLAVISSEDQIFPDHSGFDWKNIKKAMEYNKRKPNRIRGASTISQQVAKNVFLWQGRDWVRKGLELYFTKMIEWIWGKQRILDVYVNVIEMGPGIYGAEAASQAYFGKPAKNLTRKEAAMIAACLPNPKRFTVKPASPYVRGRSNWILVQMLFLEKDPDVQAVIK